MGFLFDTAFLIDLVRGDANARSKAELVEATNASTLLATPVLYEIMAGLLFRRSRTEANRFRRVVSRFELLPFDEHAARAAAEIQAELMRLGRRSANVDVMIAGIAAHNGHVLVTRDANLAGLEGGLGLDVETY